RSKADSGTGAVGRLAPRGSVHTISSSTEPSGRTASTDHMARDAPADSRRTFVTASPTSACTRAAMASAALIGCRARSPPPREPGPPLGDDHGAKVEDGDLGDLLGGAEDVARESTQPPGAEGAHDVGGDGRQDERRRDPQPGEQGAHGQ